MSETNYPGWFGQAAKNPSSMMVVLAQAARKAGVAQGSAQVQQAVADAPFERRVVEIERRSLLKVLEGCNDSPIESIGPRHCERNFREVILWVA